MKNGDFDQSITFNLVDAIGNLSNSIVVANILDENTCTIQAVAFDFGKSLFYRKSTFSRFIPIIEGKAEVVTNNNSTFIQSGGFHHYPSKHS